MILDSSDRVNIDICKERERATTSLTRIADTCRLFKIDYIALSEL
jgi:hypothetical protein